MAGKTQPPARRWATLQQGADYMSCSVDTLRRYISAGTIPGYRIGGFSTRRKATIRVDLNELDAAMVQIPSAKTDWSRHPRY